MYCSVPDADGSPPTDGEKKQVGVRGRGAQEQGADCAKTWGGKGCGWLWDVMNLLSREEDERALRDQWDRNIITRHHPGEQGWGSYGSKGSLAKALSWADPRTLKKQTKDVLSGIEGSNFGAGRVAEDWGGGVPYSPS